MSDEPIVDAVPVEDTGAELVPAPAPATLFRTDDPTEVIERATVVADKLKEILRRQNMVSNISGREHVKVEGWTTTGAMLGVVPVVVWTRQTETGWEARVECRTLDGRVVGAAEAMCSRDERTWKNRDDYAIRSMAQTRATSKALRQPLGFVVTLAGFEATPDEEMPAAQAGPEFGPECADNPLASTSLTALLDGDVDAAREVWGQIKNALGYMPDAVARAFWFAAQAKTPSIIEQAKEKLGAEEVKA